MNAGDDTRGTKLRQRVILGQTFIALLMADRGRRVFLLGRLHKDHHWLREGLFDDKRFKLLFDAFVRECVKLADF